MTRPTSHAPDLQALGAFVRARRRELGLTQTGLADRLDWAQERVSVLESGKYGLPALPALAYLAEALEVSLVQVLSVTGYQEVEASALPVPVEEREMVVTASARDRASIQQLCDGNRRLAARLEALQSRVVELERQMLQADDLRAQLAMRREQMQRQVAEALGSRRVDA